MFAGLFADRGLETSKSYDCFDNKVKHEWIVFSITKIQTDWN